MSSIIGSLISLVFDINDIEGIRNKEYDDKTREERRYESREDVRNEENQITVIAIEDGTNAKYNGDNATNEYDVDEDIETQIRIDKYRGSDVDRSE